jgi:RNA polymerase sigma-70 factor (ECF subfamily)
MKSYGTEYALSRFSLQGPATAMKTAETDPGDFHETIEPVKGKLYNYIHKALNFSEDCEDVYQETVVKAYRNLSRFKKKSSLQTWLFSIAINEIRLYYKKKSHRESREGGLLTENILAASGGADKILVEDVYEIARSFKLKYRQVFFLFYYNRFTIEEIKEITGIKSGSIKYILNFCRESIKKELGEKNGQENQ